MASGVYSNRSASSARGELFRLEKGTGTQLDLVFLVMNLLDLCDSLHLDFDAAVVEARRCEAVFATEDA